MTEERDVRKSMDTLAKQLTMDVDTLKSQHNRLYTQVGWGERVHCCACTQAIGCDWMQLVYDYVTYVHVCDVVLHKHDLYINVATLSSQLCATVGSRGVSCM